MARPISLNASLLIYTIRLSEYECGYEDGDYWPKKK